MWVVILIVLSQGLATSVAVPVTNQAACEALAISAETAFRAHLPASARVWTVCQFDELLAPLEEFDEDLEP